MGKSKWIGKIYKKGQDTTKEGNEAQNEGKTSNEGSNDTTNTQSQVSEGFKVPKGTNASSLRKFSKFKK
jgi:hypothetical protein